MRDEIVEAPAPISICPHCGSNEGYYTKDNFRGRTEFAHKYDGAFADNSEMYSQLLHVQGKYAYCLSCRKRLFKIE